MHRRIPEQKRTPLQEARDETMTAQVKLNRPWLVAVWPGMGLVALNAGVYLMRQMQMRLLAEVQAGDLFDVDSAVVEDGIVQPAYAPQSRFFLWSDPAGKRDLIVFAGEAQPAVCKYAFCRRLVAQAQQMGVERVFTFAAMGTPMRPEDPSRVCAAATDREELEELTRLGAAPLEGGCVSGLNGVLLATAAEAGLRGACLLGEMPQVLYQLPFPKASLAVLEVFAPLMGLDVDLADLAGSAQTNADELGELLTRVEQECGEAPPFGEEEPEPEPVVEAAQPEHPDPVEERRIERLFDQAAADRSKAVELKRELDRLGVFAEYEDRFLDLFSKA
jgi:proteasome assembly chaperone (PAC2) family protein